MDAFKWIEFTDLESMCDGTFEFNRKGLPGFRPPKPITIIITSNRDPVDVYGEKTVNGNVVKSRMPLFRSRFRILNINELD